VGKRGFLRALNLPCWITSMVTIRYGSATARASRPRQPTERLPPRWILAADGHASRQEQTRGTVVERQCAVEDMELSSHFGGAYEGCRVLLTGHTGFKGSWLALWLANSAHGCTARRLHRTPSRHTGRRSRFPTWQTIASTSVMRALWRARSAIRVRRSCFTWRRSRLCVVDTASRTGRSRRT